jgi:hypothetical protein
VSWRDIQNMHESTYQPRKSSQRRATLPTPGCVPSGADTEKNQHFFEIMKLHAQCSPATQSP